MIQVITYNDTSTAEDICSAASKLITFIDLAGHYKYMKTTIFGLTGYCPASVMLVVGANTGMGKFIMYLQSILSKSNSLGDRKNVRIAKS